MLPSVLSPHQRAVAERVLTEEWRSRRHLVVSLSGAHAYGFPSPDSDLDLKAVHVEPTPRLLGLHPPRATFDRLETIDGVEIDYTSNEVQMVLLGAMAGNGNYLERILGACSLESGRELASLREVAQASLSRRLHHHYRGFALSQLHEVEKAESPPAKRVLYVLRTALTGTHALRTGRVVTDLTELLDDYGLGEARALVEAKRAGERALLSAAERERWLGRIAAILQGLDDAVPRSVLPAECPNAPDWEAWLLKVRGVA